MNDIALELAKLHIIEGAEFVRQLKLIVTYKEFQYIEAGIYSAIGEENDDYQALLNAARKAVAHGYNVYILPNPKNIRTADFIFERKGVYKMYDLKTVMGQSSVLNRLIESMGQANNVLLNISCNYKARLLAKEISKYFQMNGKALEVLIFKGNKQIQVKRVSAENKDFIGKFITVYQK